MSVMVLAVKGASIVMIRLPVCREMSAFGCGAVWKMEKSFKCDVGADSVMS